MGGGGPTPKLGAHLLPYTLWPEALMVSVNYIVSSDIIYFFNDHIILKFISYEFLCGH